MDGERTGVVDEVLKLSDIARRPKNRTPRKVGQLLEQLVAEGQLNAVLVRKRGGKVPKGDPKPFASFELIGGERRCAALELADDTGVTVPGRAPGTVRAVIFDVDDVGAARKAAIDNLGREDPTALEQGEIYADMLESGACVTVDELAARVGKSPQYVSQRMSLRRLDEELIGLLEGDKLDVGAAIAVAQMPAAAQEKVAAPIAKLAAKGRVTRTQVEQLIEKFTHELRSAPFDRSDATLVPDAGPCTTCPKRTGLQGALLDIGDDEDTCLDGACWKRKSDADWSRKTEAARGKVGLKVLSESESKKVIAGGGHILHNAPYVDPDEKHYSSVLGNYVDLRKVVTPDMPRALIRDPSTGGAVELVERKAVTAAISELEKKAKARVKKGGSAAPRENAYAKQQAKARDKAAENARTHVVAVERAGDVVRGGKRELAAIAHMLVAFIFEKVGEDAMRAVGKARKLEPKKPPKGSWGGGEWRSSVEEVLVELQRSANGKALSPALLALGVELAFADRVPHHAHARMEVPSELQLLGVDVKACAAEAEKRHREAKLPKLSNGAPVSPKVAKQIAAAKAAKKGRR
jgi:ParB/RepB/Spo0J family partition protein